MGATLLDPMSKALPPIIACMHELPLESTGGGVLLREILRHFACDRRVVALYPVYPHQSGKVAELDQALTSESITPAPRPIAPDWGKPSFTIRRLLSRRPGLVVALDHIGKKRPLKKLGAAYPDALWLVVSPFSLDYVPPAIPSERIALYFTNVDENIVAHSTGTLRQRIEGNLERVRVRRWLGRASCRAGRLAAITEDNAGILTAKLGRAVRHVPPLMAPRPIDRAHAEPGLVLLTTNYTYPHNRISLEWFLHEVWPHTDPRLRLEVTGLDDAHGSLARLLVNTPRARYLGFVGKTVLDDCFSRCATVINPTISGSGFQIKMLDALARGVPLISTRLANPIGARLPSTDEPLEFARLLNDGASGGASIPAFDYPRFFADASERWAAFLEPSS
ncbi:MAG: hypothetical protein BWY57_01723 [Betaproteobacteria bacterium ADurb.Bin341]|nr:MAG: hypothetical protein BWY57_01723 [Betaproteobacteria bacterium ADurb.Bin341]